MNLTQPRRSRLFLFLYLFILPSLATASGTRIGFKDAFAAGRANAFVATADNASAVYYNPAGLTQLQGSRASAAVYAVDLKSDFDAPGGGTASLDRETALLPQFFYAHGTADGKLAFGLCAFIPFGLSTDWPDQSGFRTLAGRSELDVQTVAAVLAWSPLPGLSIGGGPNYNRAHLDLRRGIGVFPGDSIRFTGDGTDVGFQLGLLWQPQTRHSFGLSYQSERRIGLSGSTDADPFFTDDPTRASFVFPENIIAGYSFRPSPSWNLEVNLDWTNWNRFNTVLLQKASGDLPLVFDWDSGFFYEFGATHYFRENWRLSAGYLFAENSVPDATYTPAVPDSDRHFLCLGIGRRGNRLGWDLALQYGASPDRTVSESPSSLPSGESADGSYENSVAAFFFSLDWIF